MKLLSMIFPMQTILLDEQNNKCITCPLCQNKQTSAFGCICHLAVDFKTKWYLQWQKQFEFTAEFDSFRLVEWQQTQANVLRDMPNWRLYWTENEIGNWSTIIRFSVPGKLSSLFVSRLFQFRSWSKRELAHSSVGCLLHPFLIDTNTHKPIEMCRFFWELSAFLSIGTRLRRHFSLH